MTSVSNTSPLLYLRQLRHLDLLPTIYERIAVPTAVAAELEEGKRTGHDVPDPARLEWALVVAPSAPILLKLATDLGAGGCW